MRLPNQPRQGTIALCVRTKEGKPEFLEAISDDDEIALLENALQDRMNDPLETVRAFREQRKIEDEKFGDYVEDLLSQPFLRPQVQEQAVQWLRSKIRIEEFQQSETEATKVIAAYAYQVFCDNPEKKDFTLLGKSAAVRIRVFDVEEIVESDFSRAS